MRKFVLLLVALVGVLTIQAEDYTYLTFETTDGAKTSVDVSSLPVTINLDNATLTIGNQTFALADLSKMYFSTQSETTGIETIDNGQWIIPNRSLGPISSGDVKVFSCSPESKECLALIHGSHKT